MRFVNKVLVAVIRHLVEKKCYGNKHVPEERVFKNFIRNLTKDDKRVLEKEYRKLLNEGYIYRMKKRTGSGEDWHISLNPHMVGQLYTLLEKDNEER